MERDSKETKFCRSGYTDARSCCAYKCTQYSLVRINTKMTHILKFLENEKKKKKKEKKKEKRNKTTEKYCSVVAFNSVVPFKNSKGTRVVATVCSII